MPVTGVWECLVSSTVISDRPPLEPSAIGQFIAVDECPQFHKFEFDSEANRARQSNREWKEAFEPLSLLMAKDGQDFEETVRKEMASQAAGYTDHSAIEDWPQSQSMLKQFIQNGAALHTGSAPLIASEVRLAGNVEAWPIVGDADLMICWSTDTGIRIRILEIKAAHEEKTYQQLQVATYSLLFKQFIELLDEDYNYDIEGGVIHRETPLEGLNQGDLPRFSLSEYELDIRRLLMHGGKFDELYAAEIDDVSYQLAPKCLGCAYKEACFTESIETQSTALLGLTRGEQQKLSKQGVDTLTELASLAYPPREPRPYEYEELTPARRDKYEALMSEPGLGARLPEYIQRAQAMVAEYRPDFQHTPKTDRRAPWLLGSGQGNLPADDPPFEIELGFPRGTLLRVYLHVEWDHRRDSIVMLSAYLAATETGESFHVSSLIDDVHTDQQATRIAEGELLREFFVKVFDRLRRLSVAVGHEDKAPFHFYVYSSQEEHVLTEALKRHDDEHICRAVYDLFGLRAGLSETTVDQSMLSAVQEEVKSRIALPIPNEGLLPVMEYFKPTEDFFDRSDWMYTRETGEEIDLREAFRTKLFDFTVPFERDNGEIVLDVNTDDPDGFYPSRARQGSHIPLEYIWGALGKLTDKWIDDLQDEYQAVESLEPFRWINAAEQSTRLVKADLRALGERLAKCTAHIERALHYRNSEIEKQPIELDMIEQFAFEDSTLTRACREFLQLEYTSQRSERLTHYALPIQQRVQRGESIPFVVTEADVTDRGDLRVEGRLLYDTMFEDGERVAAACRQKGAQEATSGSWMVANEMTRQAEPVRSSDPYTIERGPGVTIQRLDIKSKYIEISAIEGFTPWDQEFKRRHRDWTIEESEGDANTVYFGPGELFILDPRSDDLTAQRAYNILSTESAHAYAATMESLIRSGGDIEAYAGFEQGPVSEFRDALDEVLDWELNPDQARFIMETSDRLAFLQGPPGTGKTGGTLAPTALSRIASFDAVDSTANGILVGESNKAVDELLEDTADLLAELDQVAHFDWVDDVRLIRLANAAPSSPHSYIEYVNYHDDTAVVTSLAESLLAATTGGADEDSFDHVLLFTTPARLYGFINKFDQVMDDSWKPADFISAGAATFFDFLIADEASMMRLPSFLLCTAFLKEDNQVLIGGDHRQLSPVRVHDWDTETRRTARELAPYMSTLDFMRALNDPSLDILPDDTVFSDPVDIPGFTLDRTYRCHETVAEFLQTNVYAQDSIQYTSAQTDLINPPTPSTPGLEAVLDPRYPFVVIEYSDQHYQQSNPIEAALTAAIISDLDTETSAGLVTPHNAQRGLLSTMVDDETEVDTVERFQGDEKDAIIVSATASDPDFLASEEEFILNPNRLNVSLSRMRQKLIVIASESVFGLIPTDVDTYRAASLWKALLREANILEAPPIWEGEALDFLPDHQSLPENPTLRVYPIGDQSGSSND